MRHRNPALSYLSRLVMLLAYGFAAYILRALRRESRKKIQAGKLRGNIKKIQDKHRAVKRAFCSIFSTLLECRNSAPLPFLAKQQITFDFDRNVMNFVTSAPN